MEARAYIKNVKVTPKKLRFLLPEIKKMRPAQALERLLYVEKKPARILYKAIQSAMHNAKAVLKVDDANVVFKALSIEEGQKLKRYKAGGRGNVKPFMRRFSHINIVLTVGKSKKTEPKLKVETKKEEQQLKGKKK